MKANQKFKKKQIIKFIKSIKIDTIDISREAVEKASKNGYRRFKPGKIIEIHITGHTK